MSLTFSIPSSYKQNKFNLLREQSEGYTKLSTELIQSIGAPHSSTTALPTESSDIIEARACAAWEKVVGLIGYFDLDPSRALDIILDVLTTHITTHYSFFLALLRASTWHRTQVPDVHASRMEVDDAKRGHYKNKTLDEVLTISEGESFSKPRNASKAQVCAEVLGFKFAHYQVLVYAYCLLHSYTHIGRIGPRCPREHTEGVVCNGSASDQRGYHHSRGPIPTR